MADLRKECDELTAIFVSIIKASKKENQLRRRILNYSYGDNDHLSGMQRKRFHRLSCLPGARTAARQHGNAAALYELSREGDRRLSRVPGGEESDWRRKQEGRKKS